MPEGGCTSSHGHPQGSVGQADLQRARDAKPALENAKYADPQSANAAARQSSRSISASASSHTALCRFLGTAIWAFSLQLHCPRVVNEVQRMAWRFAVALPTASNSTGRFQMQRRRIADAACGHGAEAAHRTAIRQTAGVIAKAVYLNRPVVVGLRFGLRERWKSNDRERITHRAKAARSRTD
jgi:hypothetical protein